MLPERPDGTPNVRISDAERERAVAFLRTHTADGRLTLDEFSDRVGDVYAASTAGDLEKVVADLPAIEAEPGVVPETRRRRAVRWTVSIMGGNARKGRWRVADRTTAIAIMGGSELDLRKAEFEGNEINIFAIALMGGIDIIVPEGVEVELGGIAIMGGKDSRIRHQNLGPGAPIVRVRVLAIMGGVNVRTKTERSAEQRAIERQQRYEQRAVRRGQPRGAPAIGGPRAEPVTAAALPPEGTVTIMFTDIEGSTELFERIGDGAARRVLSEHNQLVRDEVATHGGHEVKCNGDGFMVVFPSAAKALRCAAALQRRFADFLADQGSERVRVRIGLHTGDVEAQDGDFVGRAVTLAARVADSAMGGEVLVSSLVRELAGSNGDFAFDEGRQVDLKGLTGPHVVYALDWKV